MDQRRLYCCCFLICWACIACAEAPRIEVSDTVPTLSIESLYDPQHRFKYVDSPTAITRWVKSLHDQPELLVKHDDGWKRISLQTGEEEEYGTIAELTANVKQLEGLDEQENAKVTGKWLSQFNSPSEFSLISINDSIALLKLGEQPRWVTRSAKSWREVSLSPDAKQVAYVEANDLFVMQLESGRVTRITDNGSPTKLNGILDWVYQEEVYGRGNYRGYWWRKDSAAIAFLRLDASQVKEFTVTGSNGPRGEVLVERYPKVGDALPQAELWYAKLDRSDNEDVVSITPLLTDFDSPDTLITRVGWNDHTSALMVQTSNRIQNDVSLFTIDVEQPAQRHRVVHEQCDKWLEVQELPRTLKSGDYLRLSDLPTGRRRLWRISQDGAVRMPLTPADFDVRELLFVDADDRYAIITGDRLRGTVGQQLYQVNLSTNASLMLNQLTDQTAWHSASISKDGNWLVDRASSLTSPTATWLQSLTDASITPKLIHQERIKLPEAPLEVTWPTIKAEGGATLPAYLVRPRVQRGTLSQKFPVLVEVYGGPLTPSVRDVWSSGRYLFHQMLARQGIGVLVMDNRSSGGRGLADSWSIHRHMGEIECRDVIAVADWLSKQDWVDAKKLALRGWSFGGYLTLYTMTHSDKFAAGIAGGSVTDWRNYDAVYTERYMGLPSDNQAGYDLTSPILAASTMHGRVMMLHGEVDDNVHLANMMQMATALQRAGKPFEMMIYPGSAHAVHDPAQNFHLMQTTLEFLHRELR